MNTVRELLQDKIHEVASIAPDKSAHDAMQLMADKKIGVLLVEENGKMVGIIYIGDLSKIQSSSGKLS